MRFQTIFAFLLIAALTACGGKGNRNNPEAHESDQQTTVLFETRIAPTYAKGFNITYKDGYCLVDIQDPQKENTQQFHYALIPRGMEVSGLPEGYEPIRVPVRKAICMTSLQLSSFIKLDETERVVGITSTRHLFNEKVNHQIETGQTTKIGIEGNFDNEVIMSINPDLILISPFKRGGYDVLKEMDIPLMPYLGYKETTPLGQAEWIKFTGLLLGEEKKANALFAEIERRYNELKAMADSVETRPMVFSGELRGGNWYAVGGKSFLAQQFHDAGADYFLKDDDRSGGVYLDYETVYSGGERPVLAHRQQRRELLLRDPGRERPALPRLPGLPREGHHLLQHPQASLLREHADGARGGPGGPDQGFPSRPVARLPTCLLQTITLITR